MHDKMRFGCCRLVVFSRVNAKTSGRAKIATLYGRRRAPRPPDNNLSSRSFTLRPLLLSAIVADTSTLKASRHGPPMAAVVGSGSSLMFPAQLQTKHLKGENAFRWR